MALSFLSSCWVLNQIGLETPLELRHEEGVELIWNDL
jgi:hypothetical protein